MGLEQHIKRIDRYLKKDEGAPLIVDVQNSADQKAIVEHYKVRGDILLRTAFSYCAPDEMPRIEELLNELLTQDGLMLVTGVTAFLWLKGEDALRGFLRDLLKMSIAGHAIVVTRQCASFLPNDDPRLSRLIVKVEGCAQKAPSLVFAPPGIPLPKGCKAFNGIENLAEAVEGSSSDAVVYVVTGKKRSAFPNPMYAIQFIEDAYAAISLKCEDAMPDESLGTDAEWSYALTLFEGRSSWAEVIDSAFKNHRMLEYALNDYSSFSDEQKWLYLVSLKMFGAGGNEYLESAARQAKSAQDFIARVYRCLLGKSASDKDFGECYQSRKQVLKALGNPAEELSAYCRLALEKGIDAICYLTDATQQEKEAVFEYLDRYGQDVNQDELMKRLQTVYPELYSYLSSTYCFGNKSFDFDQYFQDYKWQKATNKIWPQFEAQVEKLARTRDYYRFLPPRSSVTEKLNREDAQLYFMDAMGVEYLSYIVALCHKLALDVDIKVCAAELPTITCFNNEFVALFADSAHETVSFKEIDDIKHHGKYNYDFYKNSKLPIHLIKEMEAIRDVLAKIKEDLYSGAIKRAFMIADHGASRLAVLHNTENVWEMSEKGEHSGRCCPKSDLDVQPDFAVDAGGFWALANYDRFKGGRKANVEAHGGATLEEVCVPVIKLENLQENVRVELMDANCKTGEDGVPVIEVSFNMKSFELKIFSPERSLNDVNLLINGKRYPAKECGGGFYLATIEGIKKPGKYTADVCEGYNKIASALSFTLTKKKAAKEQDLL